MARTRRMLVLRALASAVVGGVVLVGALAAYLLTADLGRHRDRVSGFLSGALGYEVEIGSLRLELAVAEPATIEVRGLRLANPAWVGDPGLATADRISARVELWPLLRRTVRVRDLELDRVRAHVASDGRRRSNWTPAEGAGWLWQRPSSPPRIEIDRSIATAVAATVSSSDGSRVVELTIDRLELATDAANVVTIDLDGACNGRPLRADGTAGPLAELLRAGAVQADLRLGLGRATGTLDARVADLARLAGVDATVTAAGPDAGEITAALGLPSPGDGGFRIELALEPAGERTRIHLRSAVGALQAAADGTVDSLVAPETVDVAGSVAGPDLAAAGALVGVGGLPTATFRLAGRVGWSGFPLALDGVELQVGDNRISADGVLGAPPSLAGSDLRVEGDGPDAAAVGTVLGLDLPGAPYRIGGRLRRVDAGTAVEDVEIRIGDAAARIGGRIGDPPGLDGTDVTFGADAPSLVPFRGLAGADLPDAPFELEARLVVDRESIRLDRTTARLGGVTATVTGRGPPPPDPVGTTVHVTVAGADLSELRWVTDAVELPTAEFRIEGDVGLGRSEILMSSVRASLGTAGATVDGRVGMGSERGRADLTVSASGQDLGALLAPFGKRAEGVPFDLRAGLRASDGRLAVEDGRLRVAGAELILSADTPLEWPPVGATFDVSASGPRLSDLEVLGAPPGLPPSPFRVSGAAVVEAGAVRLRDGTAALDDGHSATIDGVLAHRPRLVGSDLRLQLAGPDLAELGRAVSVLVDVPVLPPRSYGLDLDVAVADGGTTIRRLRAHVGATTADVSGRVGWWPEMRDTDLTVDLTGPDSAPLAAALGIDLSPGPVEIRGRIEGSRGGATFDDVVVRLGGYNLTADGRLGGPPKYVGSDLRFRVEGPDLEIVRRLTGRPGLPSAPFSVAGAVRGSPRRFRVDGLEASFGASDLRGGVEIAFLERPKITARASSDAFDLVELLPRHDTGRTDTEPETTAAPRREQLLSDTPFELSPLRALDADVEWRIGRLRLPASTVEELRLALRLDDGRLEIGPFAATGAGGGEFEGHLVLSPDGDSYRLETELRLEDGQAAFSRRARTGDGDASELDVRIQLRAHGRSPRELAIGADGELVFAASGGEVDGSIVDRLGTPLIVNLVNTLNPFRDRDATTVPLVCAVIVADASAGVLVLEPMAIKTGNVTILGQGEIDLATEDLELLWISKPRKGLGVLSASTITNSFVKLGGTLAAPRIEAKPLELVTSTGLAVVTGGISLLAKGILDRVMAERDVCGRALEASRARLAGEPPAKKPLF